MIMNIPYKDYPNRAEWLEGRKNSLGASDISIALGISSFKSPIDLWKEKTGRKKSRDISNNPNVKYGTEAEKHIRALFELKHQGEYEMAHFPYRIYTSSEHPFLSATLDGELTRISDGEKGIYEVKTALIHRKADLEEWNGKIPQSYFCQICQQFFVTKWTFAILNAELRFPDNSSEIREYFIERKDHEEDISYTASEGVQFWQYVERDEEPPMRITL